MPDFFVKQQYIKPIDSHPSSTPQQADRPWMDGLDGLLAEDRLEDNQHIEFYLVIEETFI